MTERTGAGKMPAPLHNQDRSPHGRICLARCPSQRAGAAQPSGINGLQTVKELTRKVCPQNQ